MDPVPKRSNDDPRRRPVDGDHRDRRTVAAGGGRHRRRRWRRRMGQWQWSGRGDVCRRRDRLCGEHGVVRIRGTTRRGGRDRPAVPHLAEERGRRLTEPGAWRSGTASATPSAHRLTLQFGGFPQWCPPSHALHLQVQPPLACETRIAIHLCRLGQTSTYDYFSLVRFTLSWYTSTA